MDKHILLLLKFFGLEKPDSIEQLVPFGKELKSGHFKRAVFSEEKKIFS